jgi:hypothetical protein
MGPRHHHVKTPAFSIVPLSGSQSAEQLLSTIKNTVAICT